MPLGTEVDLGPGHTVLDGDSSPRERGTAAPPQFSVDVYCVQTAGWIKIPLGTEIGLSQDDIVLDGDPAPPPLKVAQPIHFSAVVYCGQNAAHFSYRRARVSLTELIVRYRYGSGPWPLCFFLFQFRLFRESLVRVWRWTVMPQKCAEELKVAFRNVGPLVRPCSGEHLEHP